MNWGLQLFYWAILLAVLMAPSWAGSMVPGLGAELGTDLIRWNQRPKSGSAEELSQNFSQMFLEQVYLKNYMKNPELFQPEDSDQSVVPAASPMYAELMRQALAKELARSDRLKLNAKLKPYFEKRQKAQQLRTVQLQNPEIN